MTSPNHFVHLHLHSEYSLVDGLIRVKQLAKNVAAANMPAVALTDVSNLFAMIKFYRSALGAGVKPIIGADLWLQRQPDVFNRFVLLCQDLDGYRNLTRLISHSYQHGHQRDFTVIDFDWLKEWNDGLIVLSGGREGDIGRALLNGKTELAQQYLEQWKALFPDRFYLELVRTGRPQEETYIHAAIALAEATATPVVATNDVRFLKKEDFDAHEARVCINQGRTLIDPNRPRDYSDQQYLRTPQEMAELFADIPEALENSVEIAIRCNLQLTLGKSVLPDFPIPQGMSEEQFFEQQSQAGLEQRLAQLFDTSAEHFAERRKPYDERLQRELKVINQMGFPGYFLIVADFIGWARENDVPVGPGRGSGAGSLVAYALGITDLDPLAYDLLFERFLNPERVSMPDFDIDFCMERRDKVIEYVANHYGRDRVSQIATYGTMAAKAVVRDVGRVLGHPYGFVDRIAKLIPFKPGVTVTLDQVLNEEEDFKKAYEGEEEVRLLVDLAKDLEGLPRNVGKHAGGVVISPSTLTDFSPLYCEYGSSSIVTQFDKDDVEAVGLVKFDFLGLRTLTIIDWALQTINRQRAEKDEDPLDINTISLADSNAFQLLKKCQTTAVFQLESRGMKDLIRRLQPDRFEDIIALVALFRPGPLQSGMVDDFINRKHGRAKVEYPHMDLAPILEPTYGVILYQEQVMQIAQVLANYTLGGADLLRRAMGKKKPEEMAKQRDIFLKGAQEREVDPELSGYIFDLMEKFAGYGFNKCVVGSTQIIDADSGQCTTVEALFKQPRSFRIHALGSDHRLHARPVTDVVWNGCKPVYQLTTRLGKSITATANHPFRTFNGWTHLEDLKPGERIAVPRHLPIASNQVWPAYQLITLAGLIAEGNTCHPGTLYFYSNDRAQIDDFAQAAGQFPNSVARIDTRADRRMEVCVNTGLDTRFYSGMTPWNSSSANGDLALAETVAPQRCGAFLWAEQLGILGKKATEKIIPEPVFQLSDACIEVFLGRLWSGDGFIANARLKTPFYATSSAALAQDVQTLLLRLGIVSRIHQKFFKYRNGKRTGYTVHLLGETALEVFAERIVPHIVSRYQQIQQLQDYLNESERGQTSKDTIPVEIRDWVAQEREQADLTWKQVEQLSGVSVREFYGSQSTQKKRGFRRSTIKRLAQFFGSQRLQRMAEADIYWDQIISIEAKGLTDTYDLTVETDHNFVADGIIVHNSHSAAYALVSYQTAWLKAHYPAAFMAAVLSSDMDTTDKVVVFIDECRQMKLTLMPPSVNSSEYHFTVDAKGRIIYGLGAIKGVGESAIESLLQQRRQQGEFRDLFDFCRRIDSGKVNRRVLEALIRAGACDCFELNRATLMAQLPDALALAEQDLRDSNSGQTDLFGLPDTAVAITQNEITKVPDWDEEYRLGEEKKTLGLYLTGHPIERFSTELKKFVNLRLADIDSSSVGSGYDRKSEKTIVIAGLVVAIRTRNGNRGGRMAFVTLDDRSARFEIRVFSEAYEQYRELLVEDRVLVVKGTLSYDSFADDVRLNTEQIWDVDGARNEYARRLILNLNANHFSNGMLNDLAGTLAPYRAGQCSVWVDYSRPGARARLAFGEEWQIRPNEALLKNLRQLVGMDKVSLEYR